jgi:iron complex outermembrane receptor protein
MFKRKPLARSVLIALGGAMTTFAGVSPAFAQASTSQQLDRVEVTGSLIRRTDIETALPVTILRAEDFTKAGASNAEQIVQLLSQNQSSTVTANSVGSSNGGAAHADLRALGASRTLVLVNGRRMVNNPYNSVAVDLNTIPLAAIDRVEVLTDGASATYGSDAISGVINFILRREFSGVDVSAEYQKPGASGGAEKSIFNLTGGYGSLAKQGFNVMGAFSYTKQDPLKATDRDFAKSAIVESEGVFKASPTTFPANYNQSSTGVSGNPTLPGCRPPSSLFLPDVFGPRACGFDYVPFINIIPEQEQISGLLKGSLALGQDHVASLEYLKAKNKVDTVISPTPLSGLSMPSTNPFYPGGSGGTPGNAALNPALPISLGWRTTLAGGRASQAEGDTDRWVADVTGRFGNWDYKAAALTADATSKTIFTGGYLNNTGIRNGLAGTGGAPFLNPFGPQSSAGDAYVQSQLIKGELQEAKGTLSGVSVTGGTEVWKLPAGPVRLAVGAEYYKDEIEFRNNFALIRQAASSGLAGAEDITGDRNWWALAGEVSVPVAKDLEVGLSLRHDDYSDFGSTTNPKFSVRWQAMPDLLVRGSINTGFRAPTLNDVYSPNSLTFTGRRYNDPVLCPGGTVAAGGIATRDCNIQFQQQQGGNRQLDPEDSVAWTVGFVFQPIASTSFGVDYYSYKVEKSIGVLGESFIFGNTSKYANLFVRCSQASASERALIDACGIPGGDPLAYIKNTQLNLGNFETTGFDLTANWRGTPTSFGNFSAGYRSTYVMKYRYQVEPNGEYFDNIGNYFNGSPVFRYQHVATVSWQTGNWASTLINRYRGGYQDANEEAGVDPQFYRKVRDFSTFDLNVAYTGFKNVTLALGVLNLLNTDPPFSNQGDGFQVGYDQRYADPRGRVFTFRGRYTF